MAVIAKKRKKIEAILFAIQCLGKSGLFIPSDAGLAANR